MTRPQDQEGPMNPLSFNGANIVAEQLGWNMTKGWGEGDAATSAYYAPIATFEERFSAFLDRVVESGFDRVDVWCATLDFKWATDAHLEAANRALDEHGVTVVSYGGGFGATADEFRRAGEIIQALGCRVLGGRAAFFDQDRDGALAVLAEQGTLLAVENHPERSTEELAAQLVADRDGLLAATVDTGWFATQGFDPARAIRELGPAVAHVHLKDIRAAGAHDTCALGDGIVDVADCLAALQEIGYDGVISIEHEPEHYDPYPEVVLSRSRVLELLGRP
jgi:sugar phosphate isomerase/epimerase